MKAEIVQAQRGWDRLWWLLPALVAVLAYRDSPGYGYVGDARFLLETNQQMLSPDGWWLALSRDFFDSTSGNHIPYWRPLTKLSWWLETQVFGLHPSVFHSAQVLWWTVGSVAAGLIARGLGAGRGMAALAGAMVALSAPAVEAVCLMMARSDVAAAAASLAALACAVWNSQRPAVVLRAGQLLAVTVAVLSKESAVVLAPLLALHAALHARWNGATPRQSLTHALRQAGPELAVVALALTARKLVLGQQTGTQLAPDALRVLVSGGQYLLAALPLRLESGLRNLTPAEAASGKWLAQSALVWLVVTGGVALLWRQRRAGSLLVAGWGLATLAPVLLVADLNVPGATGAFAVADRWAVPLAAALAVVLGAEAGRALQQRSQAALGGVAALWCLGALAVAADLRAPYRDELAILALEDRGYTNTPAAYRTAEDHCRAADRLAVRAIADRRWQDVLKATASTGNCPDQVSRQFNRVSALVSLQRWPEARSAAEALLRLPSEDTRHIAQAHHLHAQALLYSGDARAALQALDRALAAGLRSCGLLVDRAAALEASGAAAEAAQMRALAAQCAGGGSTPERPTPDPSAPGGER